jgi:hypothetical protein
MKSKDSMSEMVKAVPKIRATPEQTIVSQIEGLENVINGVLADFNTLEQQLTPVKRDGVDEPCCKKAEDPPTFSSPIRYKIECLTEILREFDEKILRLIDRIEL